MDDKQIINLYWKRSETAIAETAKKYNRYCHSIAFNILHSNEDAEECVNDTYMRVWGVVLRKKARFWTSTVTPPRYKIIPGLLANLQICFCRSLSDCKMNLSRSSKYGSCAPKRKSSFSKETGEISLSLSMDKIYAFFPNTLTDSISSEIVSHVCFPCFGEHPDQLTNLSTVVGP